MQNPIVLISNYFFDSIPQDAFSVQDGQLNESLATLFSQQKDLDINSPDILSRIELSFQDFLARDNYYDDPDRNRILTDYANRLPSTSFLFPTAALRCIKTFHDLSGGRMLTLSGDKGYNSDEALAQGRGRPDLVMHGGSFSLSVDYQIIAAYTHSLGGQSIHPGHRHRSLNISAFMFGNGSDNYTETRQAFDQAIERFGADDLYTLKEGIERVYESFTLEQILAFLRLCCSGFPTIHRMSALPEKTST